MIFCKESGLCCHPLKDVEFCSVRLLSDWQILLVSSGLVLFLIKAGLYLFCVSFQDSEVFSQCGPYY